MVLTLSDQEQEYLLNVLEQYHRELFNEIAHTDHREFRQRLLNNEKILDTLIGRLQTTAGQEVRA